MGLFDSLKGFLRAVDTEYDRRIRAASNVRVYHIGGHEARDTNAVAGDHTNGHTSPAEIERIQGEGGALGDLQSNAGPQLRNGG